LLLGLVVEWGGTGAIDSGLATPWSVLTPTFYFGKGFGDLPESLGWLRAFAVTGQIGYQFPTRSFDVVQNAFIPQVLAYGGSIQYSMPYLKSEIHDYQLPDFINHLFPIVEAQFETPVANNFGNSPITIGTINPGVIWVGTYFQVGAEAVFPVNRASGTGVGFLGQLHFYLDDMFPTTNRPTAARRQFRSSATGQILRHSHATPHLHLWVAVGDVRQHRRACPRLSRSRESTRRQHCGERAARGHVDVHAKPRGGFQQCGSDGPKRCPRRCGETADQRQHYARRT
jgi:hypothetical protein